MGTMDQLYSDEEIDFCYGLSANFQHYGFDSFDKPNERFNTLNKRNTYYYLNKYPVGYRVYSIPEYDKMKHKKLFKLILKK